MTRYSDLAKLAVDYSAAFMNHRFGCEQLARLTRKRLLEYLEAPESAVQFTELSPDLDATWKVSEAPQLASGRDELWHFGLLLTFQQAGSASYSKLTLKFGCNRANDTATIKLDRKYNVQVAESDSWLPLLQDIVSGLNEHYSSSPSAPAKPIGFLTAS